MRREKAGAIALGFSIWAVSVGLVVVLTALGITWTGIA